MAKEPPKKPLTSWWKREVSWSSVTHRWHTNMTEPSSSPPQKKLCQEHPGHNHSDSYRLNRSSYCGWELGTTDWRHTCSARWQLGSKKCTPATTLQWPESNFPSTACSRTPCGRSPGLRICPWWRSCMGPGSPKEDGSICERSWCFCLTVMIKAENLLPGDQGRLIVWWSRQKTYCQVIKAENLLPGDQSRKPITWWSKQKTYYLMIKAEDLLPDDQSRRPITWWSRQKAYYLMIKAEGLLPDDQSLLPDDQSRRPITWWSKQKTYYLMIKAEDLLPDDQGRRPITWWSRQKTYCLVIKAEDISWWSRQKTYYLMIKAEDLLPGDQGIRLIAWWSRKKTYCPPCNRLHSPWSSWCFRTWPPWSRHHLWMACTQRASHRHRHPETTSPPPDHTAEFERHGSWNPEVLAPHSQESQQACELTPVDQASEWKSVICSAESASSSARQSVVPTGMGHNTCTSSSWLS